MIRRPFFSVIIPTYNRFDFLRIAINSVIYQAFKDFELIVVDDGSTKNTADVVKQYIGEPLHQKPRVLVSTENVKNLKLANSLNSSTRIRYIYQPNKGPAAARNKGLKESKGEFICFLDSDDRFRQQKLEITYNYIKKYPQYKIFHTEEIWYRDGKLLSQKKYHKKPDGYVFKEALPICCVSISTAAIKQEVFRDTGTFDENLPACEDYEFWLRATSKYKVKLIPKALTIKEGGHSDQQSKKFPALDRFRIYSIKKLLESNILNKRQQKLTIKELKRKCEIYVKGAIKRKKAEEVKYYKNLIEEFVQAYVGKIKSTI